MWQDQKEPSFPGFYKVEIQACDIPDEKKELIDFFDGTRWGYAQFVNKWWSEKVSIPFREVPEQGFFIYGTSWLHQIKLCKFGSYGMGMDFSGPVSKNVLPDTEVLVVPILQDDWTVTK